MDDLQEFVLSKNVKKNSGFSEHTGFGVSLDLPRGEDLVILMGNRGRGYVPYRCLLTGQIYQKDLDKAFQVEGFEVIYALPVRSDQPILIAGKSERHLEKWGETQQRYERFRVSAELKDSVKSLADGIFNDVGAERASLEFMHQLETHVADKIKEAINNRDDQWEKAVGRVRMGLR